MRDRKLILGNYQTKRSQTSILFMYVNYESN